MSKARDLANAADVLDDVSATELSYVNGVTSAIQTQLNNKQAVVANVNDTEIGYLDGVTSAIQTQIDGKSSTSHNHDSTYVAKSLVDAKGDLLVGSANDTVSRLAVASTAGYVLTVDSAEATGLKWATASGDFVKVASGSFSAASSITIDNCFTSTYKRYVAYMTLNPSAHDNTRIQWRYGSSTETGNYYGSAFLYNRSNSLTNYGANPTSGNMSITSGCGAAFVTINFTGVGTGSSTDGLFFGSGQGTNSQQSFFFAGKADTARDYTGFLISAASGNFTGTYSVYGLKD